MYVYISLVVSSLLVKFFMGIEQKCTNKFSVKTFVYRWTIANMAECESVILHQANSRQNVCKWIEK